jgi:hypothetical protein
MAADPSTKDVRSALPWLDYVEIVGDGLTLTS